MSSFVALIDRRFGEMVSFYRTFSSDESWSGQIEVQPRDVLPFAYDTVEALFTQIRDQLQRGRKHIVVGTHGYPDQLPYPLIAGTNVAADSSMLDALGRAAGGSANDRQYLLNQQSMQNVAVFKDGARLDRLLAVISGIQAARIEHLEIRGCNLGSGTGLKALHTCLNSRHTVAPTVTYMSGLVTPSRQSINDAQLQHAVSSMGQKTRNYTRSDCGQPPDASGNDSLGLALRWTEVSVTPHRFSTGISALSQQAVLGWTRTALENSHFHLFGRTAPGGGWRAGTPVPIIGMWTPNGSKPWVLPGDGYDYLSFLAVENTP